MATWDRGNNFDPGVPADDAQTLAALEQAQRAFDASHRGIEVQVESPLAGVWPLLLRTDYSEDATWAGLVHRLREPQWMADGTELWFRLEPMEASFLDGLKAEQVRDHPELVSRSSRIYLADTMTMTHAEHPLLVISLSSDISKYPDETCRVVPGAVGEVDVNLDLANIDLSDLPGTTGDDGIFRGLIY